MAGAKTTVGYIHTGFIVSPTVMWCVPMIRPMKINVEFPLTLPKQEAHVGHCRSPEYNEHIKNLTSEWNQKQQSFIPHASRSLLCIRFVAVAFWAKKQFF